MDGRESNVLFSLYGIPCCVYTEMAHVSKEPKTVCFGLLLGDRRLQKKYAPCNLAVTKEKTLHNLFNTPFQGLKFHQNLVILVRIYFSDFFKDRSHWSPVAI
jgi:hypothetical protein